MSSLPALLKKHLHAPPLDPLQSVHVCLDLWGPELDTVLQLWPDKHWVEWTDHISVSASNAPWKQPRIQFAFVAAAAHCWLFFSLLSIRISRSSRQGCSPATQVPASTGLFVQVIPKCWTLHSSLLNFIQLLPTVPACPGLCKTDFPPGTSTSPLVWCH